MILSKCCHDFDILLWILQRQVVHLQSFGSLTHFRPGERPRGRHAALHRRLPSRRYLQV